MCYGNNLDWSRRLTQWSAALFLLLALTVRGDELRYVVKRNDTLYGLARRHGISVSQLADRNGLSSYARLFVGQHLVIPSVTGHTDERAYVVKRNDTLSGLARRNGISMAELAKRNGLSSDEHLSIGQRLVIPSKSARRPALDQSIQKSLDAAHVEPGRWRYIVLHHSGVDEGTVKSMDRYHREERHMENGLAYHFVIGNGHGMRDGEIAVGDRWRKQLDGGHLHSLEQNKISIGICLVGNFDKHKPTTKQMQSVQDLTEALMKRCKLSINAVKTHRQINTVKTRCPGRFFPIKTLLKRLKADG